MKDIQSGLKGKLHKKQNQSRLIPMVNLLNFSKYVFTLCLYIISTYQEKTTPSERLLFVESAYRSFDFREGLSTVEA